jgi:ribosomal protein L7/L12
MKEILKSYKFRLNPTEEQKFLMNKHFGSSRFVYNYFLNERINQYKETNKSDNYNKQSSKLAKLKHLPDAPLMQVTTSTDDKVTCMWYSTNKLLQIYEFNVTELEFLNNDVTPVSNVSNAFLVTLPVQVRANVTAVDLLKQSILNSNKLPGIKIIRECTGWGLKESKDFFENNFDNWKKIIV